MAKQLGEEVDYQQDTVLNKPLVEGGQYTLEVHEELHRLFGERAEELKKLTAEEIYELLKKKGE